HHQPRYDHYPALLGVGLLPHVDAEQENIFETLVRSNAINLHAPAQTSAIFYQEQPVSDIQAQLQSLIEKAMVTA
ncbi:MAG: hypothetical protein P9L91_08855, partial [Candidatus Zophobacter franzmannii]|nr:hypothetical protein [Candidatus Zophobacter franzmannii]